MEERAALELKKEAKAYADEHFPEEKMRNQLLPDHAIHQKLMAEYEEASSMKELNAHIDKAVRIIEQEGREYLDIDDWRDLQEEMMKASERVIEVEFNPEKMSFGEYVNLSSKALQVIEKIALKKYHQGDQSGAVSLYALLTTLDDSNDVIWYRLGISLQDSRDYERAIAAYDASLSLNPENIGAWVFSGECCLDLGDKQQAERRLEEAKRLAEESLEKDKWNEPLSILKARR